MPRLSKSRFMEGLQCEKRLYLTVFPKDPPPFDSSRGRPKASDSGAKFHKAQGHAVEEFARKKYPSGLLIDAAHYETEKALEATYEAIDARAPVIFQATLEHGGLLAKVDILKKSHGRTWDLIEVKSTTDVKEDHLTDVAFQILVCERAGLEIRNAYVMYLNKKVRAPDLSRLFVKRHVTLAARALLPQVAAAASGFQTILVEEKEPRKTIGPHCDKPYACPYKSTCWYDLPSPNIFDIPGLGKQVWDFYEKGILKPDQIDPEHLDEQKTNIVSSLVSKKPWIDSHQIKKELARWRFPLHFLDFETIGYAIPKFDLTRPYQPVPFQFSCLVVESFASDPTEHDFLQADGADPRKALLSALERAIGPTGSIVSYNQKFEIGVLKQLAEAFPEREQFVADLTKRFVDPWPILKKSVYFPEFGSSYSMKRIAPAILGDDFAYSNLQISDGMEATQVYLDLVNPSVPAEAKQAFENYLKSYCKRDTVAMLQVAMWLFEVK